MTHPIEAVLLGAGNRGMLSYGPFALAHPNELRFVAVAEPNDERRARFAQAHAIPPERQFRSWEDLIARPPLAPALVNTTMDRMHLPSAVAALEAGYHVLLEKPMAVTAEDCIRIVRAAERSSCTLQICHVLRYAPFFVAVRDIVQSGRLGDVVLVDHNENMAYWNMVHAYVRGNWARSDRSGPTILTKCCHDLDLLLWTLGRRCLELTSFGALTVFRPERVGPEIPARCTDGCPIADECPYYAPRIYLRDDESAAVLVEALAGDPEASHEVRLQALRMGPYGRCVYRSDNDVVDHQVVTMRFEGGVTATLKMNGHGYRGERTFRYEGTRATLLGSEVRNELTIGDHLTGRVETIYPTLIPSGHGGGDFGVMRAFVEAVRKPSRDVLTSARASLESHLMAFAAEQARVEGRAVGLDAFREEKERNVG